MTEVVNEDRFAWYVESYSLEFTKRYSMKRIVHPESVASHSYFVCLGLMLLHDEWCFDLGKALAMAVAHDVPEMSISDVNHHVKQRHPTLAAALKECEQDYAATLPKTIRLAYFEHLGSSREADFVRLADALQCWQYALTEQALGNVQQMEEVRISSTARVGEMIAKLWNHKRLTSL